MSRPYSPPRMPFWAPEPLNIFLNFALSCEVMGCSTLSGTPDEGPATGSLRTGEMFSKTASGPAANHEWQDLSAGCRHSRLVTNPSETTVPCCECPMRRNATPTPCLSSKPSLLSTLAISHILANASGGRLDALNIRVAVCGLICPVRSGSPVVNTQSMRRASSGDGLYSATAVNACICGSHLQSYSPAAQREDVDTPIVQFSYVPPPPVVRLSVQGRRTF